MFVIACMILVSVTDTKATYRLSSFELSVNVEVSMGDITKEKTDVIVNSVHWNLDLSASMYIISVVKELFELINAISIQRGSSIIL